MIREVRRPCTAADLAEITPPYKGGWGPPLSYDPVPWERIGRHCGFLFAFTVRSDADWDTLTLERDSEPVRYVLVVVADEWELRLGKTDPKRDDLDEGSHRHMFSLSEVLSMQKRGEKVRSGWIYAINDERVVIS